MVDNKNPNDGASFAEVTFTTNGPPTSGSVSVSPLSGYTFTTKFLMSSLNWVDDSSDYPLLYGFNYEFGYDFTGQTEYTLNFGSYSSSLSDVILPQVARSSVSMYLRNKENNNPIDN